MSVEFHCGSLVDDIIESTLTFFLKTEATYY